MMVVAVALDVLVPIPVNPNTVVPSSVMNRNGADAAIEGADAVAA